RHLFFTGAHHRWQVTLSRANLGLLFESDDGTSPGKSAAADGEILVSRGTVRVQYDECRGGAFDVSAYFVLAALDFPAAFQALCQHGHFHIVRVIFACGVIAIPLTPIVIGYPALDRPFGEHVRAVRVVSDA